MVKKKKSKKKSNKPRVIINPSIPYLEVLIEDLKNREFALDFLEKLGTMSLSKSNKKRK